MVVVRIWVRGSNRDNGFCGSRCVFDSVEEVRRYVKKLMEEDMLLEFCGCGWFYRRYFDEYGGMWCRCREEKMKKVDGKIVYYWE